MKFPTQGAFDRGEVGRLRRELQRREIGTTPEQHHLLDSERHVRGTDLGRLGDAPRKLAPAEPGERTPAEGERPGSRMREAEAAAVTSLPPSRERHSRGRS